MSLRKTNDYTSLNNFCECWCVYTGNLCINEQSRGVVNGANIKKTPHSYRSKLRAKTLSLSRRTKNIFNVAPPGNYSGQKSVDKATVFRPYTNNTKHIEFSIIEMQINSDTRIGWISAFKLCACVSDAASARCVCVCPSWRQNDELFSDKFASLAPSFAICAMFCACAVMANRSAQTMCVCVL